MRKRTHTLVLAACTALGAACGSDAALAPESPEVNWLSVLPKDTLLFTTAPGNKVQLTTQAHNWAGKVIQATGTTTFSSEDPKIAEVSGRGLVTAVRPGTTRIAAMFTTDGGTTTDSMVVWVYDRETLTMDGVYDLTATVTLEGGDWCSVPTGSLVTGVIAFQSDSSAGTGIGGTFADLRIVGPTGEPDGSTNGGIIESSMRQGPEGGVISLVLDGGEIVVHLDLRPESGLNAAILKGEFSVADRDDCGGGGTFTAERRPEG